MTIKMSSEIRKSDKRKEKWSKNKKKNWRKKIDISEVEDGLDVQRMEMRTGGLVAEKPNEQLFKIETRKNLETKVTKPVSIKFRRLMADKILVPEPDKVQGNSRRISKKKRQVERKKLIQMLSVSQKETPKKVTKENSYDNLDIWNQDIVDFNHHIHKRSAVTIHTLNVVGQKGIKRPEHMYKRPIFDKGGIEVAHPGASYNPSLETHQGLLFQETLKEMKKVKAAENIDRAIYVDPATIATSESRREEELQGLLQDDSETDDDESSKESDTTSEDGKTASAAEKRKSKKSRKIAKQLKLEKRQREVEWTNKLRENQVYQSKTFLKEITKKEKESLKRQAKRKEMKKEKRPTLSAYKFVEPNQDLQLSSEIRGSLRAVKPEGDILTDCYRNLQKRCIIEPRQKFKPPKRKFKVKYQERREFREIEL